MTEHRVSATDGKSILKAVAWTGAARYTGQAVRWGSTVVVARLLTPDDYGLVGMTALFSGIIALVSEFGIGTAVVRMRSLSHRQIGQLHGLSITLGIASYLLSALAARPLAGFFGRQEVESIVLVSSVGLVFASIQAIPMAILQRDLKFKQLASIESIAAVLLAAFTFILAKLQFGYWSLVVPALIVGALNAYRLASLTGIAIAVPKWSDIGEAYSFSAWVFVGRLAGYVYSTADFLVVGKMLGATTLGSYSFAWDLAQVPNDQINGLVSRVSGSYYSAFQDNKAASLSLFTTFLEAVSLVSVPLMIGLAAVAPEFIFVVLGEKWLPAVPLLQLLCAYASMRIVVIFIYPLLSMLGDVRFQSIVMVVGALVFPILFVLGAVKYGALGVAGAWIAGYPLVVVALYGRLRRMMDLPWTWLLRILAPSVACSSVMLVTIIITRRAMTPSEGLATLVVLVVSGMFAYFAALFLFFRARIAGYIRAVSRLRSS